jgi:hypothetical protein
LTANSAAPSPNGTANKPFKPSPLKPSSNGETATPAAAGPPPSGRNILGQFTQGNNFGRGNTVHRRMHGAHGDFIACTSFERLERLADRLFEIAMGDDLVAAVAAIKLLLAYVCGRPAQILSPELAEQMEANKLRAAVLRANCNEFEVKLP